MVDGAGALRHAGNVWIVLGSHAAPFSSIFRFGFARFFRLWQRRRRRCSSRSHDRCTFAGGPRRGRRFRLGRWFGATGGGATSPTTLRFACRFGVCFGKGRAVLSGVGRFHDFLFPAVGARYGFNRLRHADNVVVSHAAFFFKNFIGRIRTKMLAKNFVGVVKLSG